MRKIITFIFCIVLCNMVFAQSAVRVPSRMTFANIKLKITDKGREAIQEEVDRIMQSPKYFNAKVKKADIYFPIIEQAFKEEGVSPDFKYLSLQESALIPDAISTSNAVGYWQFKDFTAIEMGLRVDKYVDERMNIYASSRAAARYMKKNNFYFNNWLFALQAYQMGAGAALKVLDKKYYGAKLLVINEKTYWYVRTFLAHKIAYESAVGKTPPNPELMIYNLGEGKNLRDIAKDTNLDYELLYTYNKWLKKGRIPEDKQYPVIIVANELNKLDLTANKNKPRKIERKMPDFDSMQSSKFPVVDNKKQFITNSSWIKINGIPGVFAKNNESIRELATTGGVEIGKFLKYNDIEIDHWVKMDQLFYFKKKHAKAKTYYHVVQKNENLWSISQKYGIRLNKLMTKNRMKNTQKLKIGRVLWLRNIRPVNAPVEFKKVKKEVATAVIRLDPKQNVDQEDVTHKVKNPEIRESVIENINSNERLTDGEVKNKATFNRIPNQKLTLVKHEVKVGETLYGISKIYDVEVLELAKWNRLNLTEDINVGQFIIVYTSKTITTGLYVNNDLELDSESKELKYIVKTGDTMYKISRQYNVSIDNVLKWNKKTDHNVSVGEVLVIKVFKKVE